MKRAGVALIIVGIAWGVVAFNMETSVRVDSIYSAYIPVKSVHNLELANNRQNHIIGAGIAFISGIILFGLGVVQNSMREQSNTQQDKSVRQEVSPRFSFFCSLELYLGITVFAIYVYLQFFL